MQLNFKKSQSTVEPALIDNTSSAYMTYIRRNINRVEKEDPMSEDGTGKIYVYEYEEAQLTKQEYLVYLSEQEAANGNTENQLAIAELAEFMENNYTELQLAIAEMAEATLAALND